VVLAADLAIAAEAASSTMAYMGVGLSPDGGSSYWLPRLVGHRRAKELMFTNRRLSATEAAEIGLITEVVDDDSLVARTEELAAQLASGPTSSFGAIIAGSGSHRVGPAGYLSVGVIAVLVAILMATRRGRELLARDRPGSVAASGADGRARRPWPRRVPERSGGSARAHSWLPAWSAGCLPSPGPSTSSLSGASRGIVTDWLPRPA
jgi:hypothetical protein